MKNLLYIILIIATTFFCNSCQDGFLDKQPLDQLSSQTFWKSENDVKLALAGCYARLRDGLMGTRRMWMDGLTDDVHAMYEYYNMANMALGFINPTGGGAINDCYYPSYRGISSCNFFLANVDKTPANEFSGKSLDVYKAEARFIRAMWYFDLMNYYGDVVLYKEYVENVDAAKIAKSPKAEVLAFIYEDLDFAIANLPEAAFVGHAIKGSATALKAKVALFQEDWDKAANLALQTMQSGKFSIADDYLGLFLAPTQDNNPEIIFSVQYLAPDAPTGTFEDLNVFLGWYGCLDPYQNLVDEYESIDGLPITESPLYDPEDLTWVNRDPRLKLSMRNSTEEWPQPTYIGLTGYQCRKYVDFSVTPWRYGALNSDQDAVYLRYADVLLMYAEAKNEVSGPDPSIYEALDEIRARPGVNMPPIDRSRFNTKELLREKIRHERRIELALEGHRYMDIKRWKIATEVMPAVTNPAGVPLNFEEKHYLWPFPQAEIDNNPDLEQNPDYK